VFVNRREARHVPEGESELLAEQYRSSGAEWTEVAFEDTQFAAQVAVVADADILVGAHGAGLTHCLYLRPGSVCAQLRPPTLPTWESLLFARVAQLAQVGFVEWTSSCGAADNWLWTGPQFSDQDPQAVAAFAVQTLLEYVVRNDLAADPRVVAGAAIDWDAVTP
jgi:hypothetical protein